MQNILWKFKFKFHCGNLKDYLIKLLRHLLPTASDNSPTPLTDYRGNKIIVKFNETILGQPKGSYTHGNIVNIYIVSELGASSSHTDHPTLKIVYFVLSH